MDRYVPVRLTGMMRCLCRTSEVGGGLVEVRGALTHQENERKRQELWLKERLVDGVCGIEKS